MAIVVLKRLYRLWYQNVFDLYCSHYVDDSLSSLLGVEGASVDTAIHDPGNPDDIEGPSSPVTTHCIMHTNEGCHVNEKCSMYMNDSDLNYICVCQKGYRRDSQNMCAGMCNIAVMGLYIFLELNGYA